MIQGSKIIWRPKLLVLTLLAIGVAVYAAIWPANAEADVGPILNSANGHYYKRVDSPGLGWSAAKAAAEAQTYLGVPGHLATITSAEENDFLVANDLVDNPPYPVGGFWLGGFQPQPEAGSPPDPAAGWAWVTGEPFVYTNWYPEEPNDYFGPGSEDKLEISPAWAGAGGIGKWGDVSNDGGNFQQAGYIVEFDVPLAQPSDSDGDLLSDADEVACGSNPFDATSRCDGFCGLPLIDVYDSTDPNNFVLIGQIKTIQSAETGSSHYDFSSASGHPLCVDLQPIFANVWMHENTNDGDLTFGFIFSKDNGAVSNSAEVNFRIVGSTTDPFVSQSDDPGEAVETPAGSNAFKGNYTYGDNTDGIAVSGISGTAWTVIIDSVNFGNITNWFAAGGGTSDTSSCTDDLPDLVLTLGHEYRLTPACNPPSGAPVVAEICNDGIDNDGDGLIDNADPDCHICGDGNLNPGEECDDGNTTNGDGCSSTCEIENQPPVALCQDITVSADANCQADANVDNASFDPDVGDSITLAQDPAGPYPLGDTDVTLTVTDSFGAQDSCMATVTVVDNTLPTIPNCNAPATIVPPDAPISFAATATDNCGDVVVKITSFDCFFFNGAGKRVDKTGSCVVSTTGNTITILDSGGVGDNIVWTATATDGSGNMTETTCRVVVVNPGKAKGK